MPVGFQWISGLSRGVSTRAALRLFVVTLCVLITLLMGVLNLVSSPPTFLSSHRNVCCSIVVVFFCLSVFPPWKKLHSDHQHD